ncbi:UDP-N-acetylmuramoyl-tripeptide--D-alanyl-D-alanine ligase [Diplocloster modestus]|uniref:UDP-N-acetylmuramoyl-tripeptide--D-alanyl-D- alanine ligase n=1 Tax=Diplocloster modestus TaxID=2850322 RepID=UPI001EE8F113|nr:UDP-N-acetylmuramoyl-tripeptide--D-alanyl-D-alanine ligase [Diplocloster modestus]
MNNLILGLYAVSFTAAFVVLSIYHMHMFQLNSYKPGPHVHWLKEHLGSMTGRVLALLVSMVLLLIPHPVFKVLAIVCNLLTLVGNRPKKAKKPLVFTKRVIRMFVTDGILFLVLSGGGILLYRFLHPAFLLVLPAIGILAPFLILLANLINRPVEKSVNRHFIREAEDILKAMPNLTIIGVTGSYGKTSVKFYLGKLLSAKYNVLVTPGNFNTTLGVVKTVREHLKATHEIFVCEMGAKTVGEIKEICDLVHPDYGVITSIGPQHLESFLSIENVIKTKFELADSIPPAGKVFLNYDNEYIRKKQLDKPVVTYGAGNPDCDFHPYDITVSRKGSSFKLDAPDGHTYEFSTKLIGIHNVVNIAGAIAVAWELGVPMQDIVTQVRKLNGVPHRLQLIPGPTRLIIDDAYNSNPSGAKAALDTLNQFEGLKILVTPGMVELGDQQYQCNKTFGLQAAAVCDYVILVGPKQTKPIQDGLAEADYPAEQFFVVNDLQEGLQKVDGINAHGTMKVVLLENDLPDNY